MQKLCLEGPPILLPLNVPKAQQGQRRASLKDQDTDIPLLKVVVNIWYCFLNTHLLWNMWSVKYFQNFYEKLHNSNIQVFTSIQVAFIFLWNGRIWSSGVARNLQQGVCKVVLPLPSLPTALSLLSSPSPSFPLEVGPLNTAIVPGGLWGEAHMGQSPSQNRFQCILALKSDIWWHQFY